MSRTGRPFAVAKEHRMKLDAEVRQRRGDYKGMRPRPLAGGLALDGTIVEKIRRVIERIVHFVFHRPV